ncbi:MAG: hypothetical protein H6710_18895, partial [Myxococcales bacterium]|nr:hypothetical protein [Myxococcales bacterium]
MRDLASDEGLSIELLAWARRRASAIVEGLGGDPEQALDMMLSATLTHWIPEPVDERSEGELRGPREGAEEAHEGEELAEEPRPARTFTRTNLLAGLVDDDERSPLMVEQDALAGEASSVAGEIVDESVGLAVADDDDESPALVDDDDTELTALADDDDDDAAESVVEVAAAPEPEREVVRHDDPLGPPLLPGLDEPAMLADEEETESAAESVAEVEEPASGPGASGEYVDPLAGIDDDDDATPVGEPAASGEYVDALAGIDDDDDDAAPASASAEASPAESGEYVDALAGIDDDDDVALSTSAPTEAASPAESGEYVDDDDAATLVNARAEAASPGESGEYVDALAGIDADDEATQASA